MKHFLKSHLWIIVLGATALGFVIDFFAIGSDVFTRWWAVSTVVFSAETVAGLLLYIYYGLVTDDLFPYLASTKRRLLTHLSFWFLLIQVWSIHLFIYLYFVNIDDAANKNANAVVAIFILLFSVMGVYGIVDLLLLKCLRQEYQSSGLV